ncbi:MAG: hypothetical protein AAB036_10585 [Elusimicrobiota bacterium]
MRLTPILLLLMTACAARRPCTRTLCVTRLEGTLELSGWQTRVRANSRSPRPPIPSDSEIALLEGSADFMNGDTKISASEGSVFRFSVSTAALASIDVSTGQVTIAPAATAPVKLAPGARFVLPQAP